MIGGVTDHKTHFSWYHSFGVTVCVSFSDQPKEKKKSRVPFKNELLCSLFVLPLFIHCVAVFLNWAGGTQLNLPTLAEREK